MSLEPRKRNKQQRKKDNKYPNPSSNTDAEPQNDKPAVPVYGNMIPEVKTGTGMAFVKTLRQKNCVALVAPQGAGKKSDLPQMTWQGDVTVFHIKLLRLDYNEVVSLKELIVDRLSQKLDAETRQNVYRWVKMHQEKVVFVLDGYHYEIIANTEPTNDLHTTPMPMLQLVTNLCYRKFFKKALVILTSPCYSVFTVPRFLMPDSLCYFKKLNVSGINRLFYIYSSKEDDNVWDMLKKNAPHLIDLCHTPLIAQLITWVALHEGFEQATTVTKVFQAITNNMTYTKGTTGPGVHELVEPLAKMSYKALRRCNIIFQQEDFKEVNLDIKDALNIVIPIARYIGLSTRQLFEGKQIASYIHHMFHEWFAAVYICKFMPEDEFENLTEEVIEEDYWAVVRMFMCGILLGDDYSHTKRQDSFSEACLKHFISLTDNQTIDWLDVLIDLLECCNEIQVKFSSNCPRCIDLVNINVTFSAAHALSRFILKVDRDIGKVNLLCCKLKSDSLRRICEGIQYMNRKILQFNLSYNDLEKSESDCLMQCKDKIEMMGCDMPDDVPKDVAKAKDNVTLAGMMGLANMTTINPPKNGK